MRRVLKYLKKIFGENDYRKPIVTPYLYNNNIDSFCGGTLSGERILVVTNFLRYEDILSVMKVEHATIRLITDFNELTAISGEKIYPYDHIINIIQYEDNIETYCAMEDIYLLLQIETDYMVEYVKEGVCTTAVLSNDDILLETVKGMISGLGKALSEHRIVSNGVVCNSIDKSSMVLKVCSFLNSKYGEIMVGAIWEMIT